jgi:hypothetical protein
MIIELAGPSLVMRAIHIDLGVAGISVDSRERALADTVRNDTYVCTSLISKLLIEFETSIFLRTKRPVRTIASLA